MNLTYKYKFVVRPSLRPKYPRTRVATQLTYGNDCMPKSTLVLVGERPMKPRKGYVLENANYFKGKWDNFTCGLLNLLNSINFGGELIVFLGIIFFGTK